MRVMIAAAGTGGHINPGIAIANKIKEKEKDSEIVFIGTTRGIENDLVPRAGYELKTVEAYGISKKISLKTISNNIKTIKGFGQAKKIVKEFNPDIVIGTGGYICGGAISAAHKLGIPTVIHESNAYPGKATKFLFKKLDKVLLGFEDAQKYFEDKSKVVVTGTPTKVKEENLTEETKEKIFAELGLKKDLPTILVFGGSQGAKAINDAMIPLIEQKKNKDYQIIWSVGQKQYEGIKESFENKGININKIENTKIVPYIYNMSEIMNAIDIIVSRSGAMTITEIALVGKPAIFIPLPSMSANRQVDNANVLAKLGAAKIVPYIYNMSEIMNAIDIIVSRSGAMTITEIALVGKPAIFIPLPSMSANRQVDNANVLAKLGAAKIILNDEINSENLSQTIADMLKDKNELKEMGNRARKIAKYDVEDKIYDEIKKLVK